MATPTDQQQIRATLRRAARTLAMRRRRRLFVSGCPTFSGPCRRALQSVCSIDATERAASAVARRGRGG
jgi:hypothetical protein